MGALWSILDFHCYGKKIVMVTHNPEKRAAEARLLIALKEVSRNYIIPPSPPLYHHHPTPMQVSVCHTISSGLKVTLKEITSHLNNLLFNATHKHNLKGLQIMQKGKEEYRGL